MYSKMVYSATGREERDAQTIFSCVRDGEVALQAAISRRHARHNDHRRRGRRQAPHERDIHGRSPDKLRATANCEFANCELASLAATFW